MSDTNPWFRMHHEILTDPKVQMLSETDQRRYVMLLCIRCRNGDETLHDDEIAFQLRIKDQEYAETKQNLIAKGLIDDCNKPLGWNKRQYLSDNSTSRVRAHRNRKKLLENVSTNNDETSGNVSETTPDTDTDTDTDTDKRTTVSPFKTPSDYFKHLAEHHGYDELVLRRKASNNTQAAQWLSDGILPIVLDAAVKHSRDLLEAQGQKHDPPIAYLAKVIASNRQSFKPVATNNHSGFSPDRYAIDETARKFKIAGADL